MKDIFAGNQVIHKMSDHYGWKEGSAEKTVLHGALGALTGKMSGGNALSGAVSGSVNEFALAYMEKTKGKTGQTSLLMQCRIFQTPSAEFCPK